MPEAARPQRSAPSTPSARKHHASSEESAARRRPDPSLPRLTATAVLRWGPDCRAVSVARLEGGGLYFLEPPLASVGEAGAVPYADWNGSVATAYEAEAVLSRLLCLASLVGTPVESEDCRNAVVLLGSVFKMGVESTIAKMEGSR
jgi:hypothetical protein